MMARSSAFMPFFYDWVEAFEELPGEQCKELLLAMVQFHKDGTEPPPFSGSSRIAAAFLFPALRRSKQCAEAGKKGGLVSASSGASTVASTTASTTASSERQANVNHKDKDEDEDEDENEYIIQSFVLSREDGDSEILVDRDAQMEYGSGEKGSYLLLSNEQQIDLLERLSLDEYNKYTSIVVECERKGKHFRNKTHYQAILDMVEKDRRITRRKAGGSV